MRPGSDVNFLCLALEDAIQKKELKYLEPFEYYFEYIEKIGIKKLIYRGKIIFNKKK